MQSVQNFDQYETNDDRLVQFRYLGYMSHLYESLELYKFLLFEWLLTTNPHGQEMT